MKQITTSKKFSINWLDIGKALLIAAITPVLVIVQSELDSGKMPSLKSIGMAAIAGACAYLIKNFFSPSKIVIKNEEPTDNTNSTNNV